MVNETEAPTNEGTAAKLAERLNPKGLTSDTLDFVTAVDMYVNLEGKVPTAEELHAKYGIPTDFFEACVSNEPVVKALAEREINIIPPKQEEWQFGVLTPIQLLVANAMVDLRDTRSDKKKLQDLGVSTVKYNRWLSNPDFANYLATRAEGMIQNGSHEASLALLDKVRQGDLKAIQFHMEYTRKYIDPAKAGQNQVNVETQDFKRLLISLLEIITDEIDDRQTAIRISERIRMLVGRENTARELVAAMTGDEEIVQPTIATARVITPDLQKFLDNGVGVNS